MSRSRSARTCLLTLRCGRLCPDRHRKSRLSTASPRTSARLMGTGCTMWLARRPHTLPQSSPPLMSIVQEQRPRFFFFSCSDRRIHRRHDSLKLTDSLPCVLRVPGSCSTSFSTSVHTPRAASGHEYPRQRRPNASDPQRHAHRSRLSLLCSRAHSLVPFAIISATSPSYFPGYIVFRATRTLAALRRTLDLGEARE